MTHSRFGAVAFRRLDGMTSPSNGRTNAELTVSSVFVDPRTQPDPRVPRPPARFATDVEERNDLHLLCRVGQLYELERLIQDGRPLQIPPGPAIDRRWRFRPALETTLERQDVSLILLLLANGYDLTAEPECPLTRALQIRRWDIVDNAGRAGRGDCGGHQGPGEVPHSQQFSAGVPVAGEAFYLPQLAEGGVVVVLLRWAFGLELAVTEPYPQSTIAALEDV